MLPRDRRLRYNRAMRSCHRPHLLLAALLAAALPSLAASCNALWGVDELSFGQGGTAGTATTMVGGGGGAAGQGGAGLSAGGQGGCTLGACGECLPANCLVDTCAVAQQACLDTAECTGAMSCMATCRWDDADCQNGCLANHPGAAGSYHEWLECAACSAAPCNATCANWCRPGCESDAGCSDCINGDCAAAACRLTIETCAASGLCTAMANCIAACSGDTACTAACATDNPTGAVEYNEVIRCLVCTKAACWDVCAAEAPSCEGF